MDQQNMYLNWCVDYEISSGHLNILDFRIHHLETLLLSNNGVLKQKNPSFGQESRQIEW